MYMHKLFSVFICYLHFTRFSSFSLISRYLLLFNCYSLPFNTYQLLLIFDIFNFIKLYVHFFALINKNYLVSFSSAIDYIGSI